MAQSPPHHILPLHFPLLQPSLSIKTSSLLLSPIRIRIRISITILRNSIIKRSSQRHTHLRDSLHRHAVKRARCKFPAQAL